MTSKQLTLLVVVGLVLGVVVGYAVHALASPATAASVADGLGLLPFAFLRLIKMLIAPLVLSTMVVGVSKIGDNATVCRIGIKAVGVFVFASLVSLVLGMVLVQRFEPGKALALKLPDAGAAPAVAAGAMSMRGFIEHTLPSSVFDAM